MSIISKIKGRFLSKINSSLFKTKWFNDTLQFAGCKAISGLNSFNIEIANLGSSSSFHAFNYMETGLVGVNLATPKQSLKEDKEMIKNYFSHLKDGGVVIIPLCLFSSLVGNDEEMPDKYYVLFQNDSIPHFSWKKKNQIYDVYTKPYKYFPLWSFPYEILRPLKKKKNCMTQRDLEIDADRWMNGWKHEFSIYDFTDKLSLRNNDSYSSSMQILEEIVDFCKTRNLKPVLVFPPVSKALSSRITKRMQEIYLDSFIQNSKVKDIPYFNYLNDKEFFDNTLFLNSFFLNNNGSKKFTSRVITDLKNIGYIKG